MAGLVDHNNEVLILGKLKEIVELDHFASKIRASILLMPAGVVRLKLLREKGVVIKFIPKRI